MTQPVIGLTLDAEEAGGYSKMPWYAIRENYCQAVYDAGGLPIALPHEPEAVDAYLNLVDGLLVTGGAFDVDPSLYGEGNRHDTVVLKERRTAFEFGITRQALARNMPVFGICGGEQLLNVVLGGTLIQHIPDSIPNALQHEQPNPRHEPGHTINIVKGTLLYDIVKSDTMDVNTAHHQAIKDPASYCLVNARSQDNVIEGIEDRTYRFCLGVQWHPEYYVDPGDRKLFTAFIQACQK